MCKINTKIMSIFVPHNRLQFLSLSTKNSNIFPMSHLLNKAAAHKLAKSIDIRLGSTGVDALNLRIEQIIKEAAEKARHDKRKTILERDVVYEPDLFS
jgi:histone H3/H4